MIVTMLLALMTAGSTQAEEDARIATELRRAAPSLAHVEHGMALIDAVGRLEEPGEERWAVIADTLPYQKARNTFEVHEGIRIYNARRAVFEASERARPDYANVLAARARFTRDCPEMGDIPDALATGR